MLLFNKTGLEKIGEFEVISIHLMLLFNGLFTKDKDALTPFQYI